MGWGVGGGVEEQNSENKKLKLISVVQKNLLKQLLNYYTNHCTYIKFIKFTH